MIAIDSLLNSEIKKLNGSELSYVASSKNNKQYSKSFAVNQLNGIKIGKASNLAEAYKKIVQDSLTKEEWHFGSKSRVRSMTQFALKGKFGGSEGSNQLTAEIIVIKRNRKPYSVTLYTTDKGELNKLVIDQITYQFVYSDILTGAQQAVYVLTKRAGL